MEQFEKVCKGLECCIPSIQECQCVDGCPYYDSCWSVDDEYDPMYLELMRDALTLIRQQQERIAELEAEHEAKVITLDGLSNYRWPVWMLEKTSSGMVGHWLKPFSGFDTGIYACFEEKCFLVEEYGKTWIPWTKKPTNERIKAVKWE